MKSKDSVTSLRMSKIRGKNTTPERNVRSYLHKKGFRFSLHKKDLPGKPDIVLKKYNAIINVNGCFWHHHQCGKYNMPKNNEKYWSDKLKKNKKRDCKNKLKLQKLGWRVFEIWECEIKKKLDFIISKL
tara:strand:- start:97 stop:483 length:387 start_codon:yes stop_codon:yes gene_type:complete